MVPPDEAFPSPDAPLAGDEGPPNPSQPLPSPPTAEEALRTQSQGATSAAFVHFESSRSRVLMPEDIVVTDRVLRITEQVFGTSPTTIVTLGGIVGTRTETVYEIALAHDGQSYLAFFRTGGDGEQFLASSFMVDASGVRLLHNTVDPAEAVRLIHAARGGE